jgi:hypothetical protein
MPRFPALLFVFAAGTCIANGATISASINSQSPYAASSSIEFNLPVLSEVYFSVAYDPPPVTNPCRVGGMQECDVYTQVQVSITQQGKMVESQAMESFLTSEGTPVHDFVYDFLVFGALSDLRLDAGTYEMTLSLTENLHGPTPTYFTESASMFVAPLADAAPTPEPGMFLPCVVGLTLAWGSRRRFRQAAG